MQYFDERGEPTTRIMLAIRFIQAMDQAERMELMKIVPCPDARRGDDPEGVARLSRWLKALAEFASENLLDYEVKGDVLVASRNRVSTLGFLPVRDVEADMGPLP
jgi:hypothetical protein